MRYPLATVIAGLEHLVAQRPLEREAQINEIQQELQKDQQAKLQFRDVAATQLRSIADQVGAGEYPKGQPLDGYHISQEVRRELDMLARDMGLLSTHERDRKARRVSELRDTRDQPTPVDATLKFLQLMVKAGETHVSANGLKQAGHDPYLLADAVVAAAEVPDAR